MKKTAAQFCPLMVSVLLMSCAHVRGSDYYVAGANASASDGNSGTATAPWKTTGKANQALSAGDTVYIGAGTYSQSIAPVNSGAAAKPITYNSVAGATVTISGITKGV